MSHPYTDHYPMPGMNVAERFGDHEKRIKALEAQLGAATVIGSKAQASEATARRQEAVTAPSVSAERSPAFWRTEAIYHRQHNNSQNASDACLLAAAVTRWYEHFQIADSAVEGRAKLAVLVGMIQQFCRGEKLPEVKP